MATVFRSYSSSEALQSDRSSGDRLRHREMVREAIRENIADLVGEQAIIGRDRNTIVKVPIRGIKEYRFVFGDNTPGVAQGTGGEEPGQVIRQAGEDGDAAPGAGDRPGVDYYETDITLDDLVELMFEDLELPDLERKALREIIAQRATKRKGYRRVGVRVQLDKKRTAKSRIRRQLATARARGQTGGQTPGESDDDSRFRFHPDDLRYRRRSPDVAYESNAVVLCIMDTSGSMDTMKKYLARSFFFLLYQFVRTRYERVELVFVAHHATAREVTEEEFFSKGESGGTMISSGYGKALEIIDERYHPSLWNIYAFHCSDGDNFDSDNEAALKMASKLCRICNLFGYGEIKPDGGHVFESSMLQKFGELDADNFEAVSIKDKSAVWKSFKRFLSKERQED